jgi:hypothetical protein
MSLDPIVDAASELQAFCTERGWRFCFIGGIAVQRWGEPRFTADADITLLAGFGGEEDFIRPLCAHFRPRRPDAEAFALRYRVLLLESQTGVGLDVALGAVPFEIKSIERASAFEIGQGKILTTCSAEDLLVHKLIANREKDWIDIEGVLVRQWDKLDLMRVRTEVQPLLDLREDYEPLHRFERLHAHLKSRLA